MPDRRNLILAVSLVAALVLVACAQDPPADPVGDVSTSSPVPTATTSVSSAQTPTTTVVVPEVTTSAVEPPGSTASTGEPATSARGDADPSPTVVSAAAPTPTALPELAANGTIPRADTAFQPAAAEELSTVDIVKLLRPSVVHIATTLDAGMSMLSQPVPEGVGTGVILDEAGHILTNNHVIQDAQRIIVTLSDGQRYPATLIGRDPRTDTAVIEISAIDLTPATLGIAADLEVGEDVIAIGHALGLV